MGDRPTVAERLAETHGIPIGDLRVGSTPRSRAGKTTGEEMFESQLTRSGVTGWVREHKFHGSRNWRFDFAWLDEMLAVEINGGTFRAKGGAHTGAGFRRDCVKGMAAIELGWTVITVMPEHVRQGRALQVLEKRLDRIRKMQAYYEAAIEKADALTRGPEWK